MRTLFKEKYSWQNSRLYIVLSFSKTLALYFLNRKRSTKNLRKMEVCELGIFTIKSHGRRMSIGIKQTVSEACDGINDACVHYLAEITV